LAGGDSALTTAILVGLGLYFARDIFIPLALAGLLAFLLAPAADRLERWRLKRLPAALIVILLCVAGLLSLGWALMGQVYNLAIELPQYQQNIAAKIESLHLRSNGQLTETLTMLTKDRDQILDAGEVPSTTQRPDGTAKSNPDHRSAIQEQHPVKPTRPVPVKIEPPGESITTIASRTAIPLIRPVTTVFIVVIFLVFMLLGRVDLRDRALKLAGKGRMHATTEAIGEASQRVSRYLRMQLIVNFCYGVVIGLALWVIGVPNPLLWAALTCLLRFIPYLGFLLAVSGPLLLSIAVSPHWGTVMWTTLTYVVVELVVANFVEPMLYGASTGISPIGILVAAIFWTFLWGLPGLLLSTPLTVCLVVIGRQISHLEFLDILFGDNEALPPPDRFYQRLLASKMRDALALLHEESKTKTIEQVHDSLVVPVLSMIEDARHSEDITGARAEELLQGIEELTEDIFGPANVPPPSSTSLRRIMCVPARDFADEIASQLAVQVLSPFCSAGTISADSPTTEMLHYLESGQPDAICVVGIPPQAIRHLRMRCHQIRTKFPSVPLVACVLSELCDLSKLRSRVPAEDAQHVVCSLQLMKDYIFSLLNPSDIDRQPTPTGLDAKTAKESNQPEQKLQVPDVFDEPKESLFNHLTSTLAHAFDAPIALLASMNGQKCFWESQSGLPDNRPLKTEGEGNPSIIHSIDLPTSGLVIADVRNDERFASDSLLQELGIRFFAGIPLKTPENETIGLLCVLDTRPREIDDEQKVLLRSIADAVMKAIELHTGEEFEESQSSDSCVAESSRLTPTNQ
jgi:predicted PurR-regulated permease PerM